MPYYLPSYVTGPSLRSRSCFPCLQLHSNFDTAEPLSSISGARFSRPPRSKHTLCPLLISPFTLRFEQVELFLFYFSLQHEHLLYNLEADTAVFITIDPSRKK